MLKFLAKLFTGNPASASGPDIPATVYEGFSIQPCPKKESAGWSTEAVITKEIDGETKTHHFIRADKTGDMDGAVTLTLNKCRMTIDQVGAGIFN